MIELSPAYPEAHHNLAVALQLLNRLEESRASYHKALDLQPGRFDSWLGLGTVLQAQNKLDEAAAAYVRAACLKPDDARPYSNLGTVYRRQGRLDGAMGSYRRALEIAPSFADAHHNLGNVLRDRRQLDEAVACYERAIQLDPAKADAYTHLGNTLQDQGRLLEAISAYDQALGLDPDSVEAHFNLGTALQYAGHPAQSTASYRRALDLDPEHADAHLGLGHTLLRDGDFARGWTEYEWRWRSTVPGRAPRDLPQPLWDGSQLQGQTILIEAEQGFGDAIQFVRYAPLVAESGGRVILECRPELRRLFQGSFEPLRVASAGDVLTDVELRTSLMSLPGLFGTQPETIPNQVPYLQADPESVATARRHLSGSELPTVGLVWATNTPEVPGRERSLPAQALDPLAQVPNVCFYSLQTGAAADQRSNVPLTDLGPRLADFNETAAMVTVLDLIITVDTAVAHLAGALGRPVWILLPFVADWRWLVDRRDSPWYPTARLFRQAQPGDWSSVIAEVREALSHWP